MTPAEVEIAPAQVTELVASKSLPRQHTKKKTPEQRHRTWMAAEKRSIFVGVEMGERFGQANFREPAARNGVLLEVTGGVDREREHASDHLGDVPPRRRGQAGRQARHHAIGVIEPKLVDANALQMRANVFAQKALVGRRVLRPHMVWVLRGELAVGPAFCELGECRRNLRALPCLPCAERVRGRKDGGPRSTGSCFCSDGKQLFDLGRMLHPAKASGHQSELRASCAGLLLRLAGIETKLAANAALDRNACREAMGQATQFSRRFAGHQHTLVSTSDNELSLRIMAYLFTVVRAGTMRLPRGRVLSSEPQGGPSWISWGLAYRALGGRRILILSSRVPRGFGA